MRLIFTVRSVAQVNVSRMLVQLQGNRGNISLDLPLGHRIYVGQEFILAGPDVVSAAISAPAAPRSTNLISLEPRDRLSREDLLD
jgi:hypothetical protein